MSVPNPLALIRQRLGLAPSGHPTSPDGAASEGHAADIQSERLMLLERSVWSLVWLGVLVGGLNLWGSWSSWPVIDALAPTLVAVALIGFAICWCSPSPRSWIHQGLAMAGALVVVAAPQVVNIHTRIYYSTDSAALDHVAARLLVQGHNPYAASLSSAALLLKTPAYFWTYTLTGGHVGSVSYPAGSFLVYAPAFALGFHHEVVDWMDLYFWLASALLVFFLVPRFLRWIAVLLALSGIFVGLFSGGGTDAAFLPFAILAVWRWDRFGRPKGMGLARWVGPVALGLACAIKQTPWFLVPFLVVGIWIETRRDGRAPAPVVLRYVVIVIGVFAAVNLPFIIWGASQWWHGTLLPLSQPLVADGQGLVSFAVHGLTGGANLSLLMDASALALLAMLAAFVAWFGALKRIWLLLLPVTFFFSPRSFTGYLIDFFPAAIVALLTVDPARAPVTDWRWGRFRPSLVALGALAAATGVLAGVSLTSAPLTLTYRSADIGPSQQHMFAVTVTATNNTNATLTPHFMVDVGAAHPTGFWTAAHDRPVVIGPHRSVTVTLFPPAGTATYLPPWAADYVVDAYTASPRALSTTNDIWHNYIPKLAHP
jgi:uncharacterized membrane protein